MSVLYQPEQRPPFLRSMLYSVQWFAFNLVNIAVVPLIVGDALGLGSEGIATLAQRTMIVVGLSSILQALFGHRLPIIEGPAGMWWAVFVTLGSIAPGMGKELPVLRTDLEFGVMTAGIVLAVMGISGVLGRALKLFTPAVTGTVLVLLTLQLSGTFLEGMLGIAEGGRVDPLAALVSLLVVVVVIVVSLKGRGFLRSIAILIGTAAGWVLAVLLGVTGSVQDISSSSIIHVPSLFAWGTPTFDAGIVLLSVLTGMLVLSNEVASILAMERTVEKSLPRKKYNRGVMITGVADFIAGAGSTVGVVPYSASAGLVSITGVASRMPFLVFAAFMILLGLLPPVGNFLTSIPAPVGYSVLLASFCQMLGFGLKDYASLKWSGRQFFVIGLPVLLGTGIITLPASVFAGVPVFLRYIVGNGFVTGMLLCILLEHVLLPEKFFPDQDDT